MAAWAITHRIKLWANAFGMSAHSMVTVPPPPPVQTFEEWKASVFSPADLTDPGISGDTADVDADTLSTVFEYLTGDDPHEAAVVRALRIGFEGIEGASKPILVARLSSTFTGYAVRVEHSIDLRTWTEFYHHAGRPSLDDPAIADFGDAGAFYEVWLNVSSGSEEGARFYRLTASPTP